LDYTYLSYLKGRRSTEYAGLTIVDILRRQAHLVPDAAAVVYKDILLTYRQFDRLTDLLASDLIRLGAARGERIGILSEHNELIPLSIFGVMKAAAAYVPLNPSHPPHRLKYMIEDAGINYLIADDELEYPIPGFKGTIIKARKYLLETDTPAISLSIAPPLPDDLMAIMYTSGSTGSPKGVIIEHKNGISFSASYKDLVRLLPGEAIPSYVSISFVLHVAEFFPAVMAGAALHIISSDIRLDTGMLNAYFEANHIVAATLPSSIGRRFIMQEKNHSLRILTIGGEGFMPLPELSLNYKIYNGYGCTECCCGITLGEIKPGDTHITAGFPFDNVDLYIVDEQGRVVGRGEKGELWAAGPEVSAGYLNQKEKTAGVFIKNPFSEEAGYERIYKTGDMARVTEKGTVEILGRVDFQIKIRGYRIEPNEIDACIKQYPGVIESVTVAAENAAGMKSLAAYVAADTKIDAGTLRDFISTFLPPYMVPHFIEQIPRLPRNMNGKVDRAALPPLSVAGSYAAPETEMEKTLAGLWERVLEMGEHQISRDADFFELGGDSLRAVILAFEIQKTLGTDLSPVEILKSSILKEQAVLLSTASRGGFNMIHAFASAGDRTPLFFVHGGNIGPEAFVPLARKLSGNRAFYCFENYNMYHPKARLKGIVPLAAKYIEFLKTQVPRGPYSLGGWSFGGQVAFEMALRLERLGETVERLYLLDPQIISSPEEKQLRKKFLTINNYQEYLEKDPLFERFRRMGFLDILIENYREIARYMLDYTPDGVYQGETTLFKAMKPDPINPSAPPESAEDIRRHQRIIGQKKDNGFGRYAPRLRTIEIPDIHDGFMRGEALEMIVAVINGT
jgi:amino acid adenylation domain-containing protein